MMSQPDFRSKETSMNQPLTLTVPYYVYENEELYWKNYTFQQQHDTDYADFKHSDDLWLSRAAMIHPQRTMIPSEAKLFFVPVLLNAVAERRMCIVVNETQRCFARPGQAYRFVDNHLSKSEYFQRSLGRDHVVVTSHWLDPPRRLPNLLQCNLINFEGYLPMPVGNGSSLPNFYVGSSCPVKTDKEFDFAMVGKMGYGNPDFQPRRDICEWLDQAHHSVSLCGTGPQCPALAQARYGFHPRGDTWGSNRVMDTVLARTVPLFTASIQYDLLPPFVPWRDISYLVNVTNREVFLESLKGLLSRPTAEYESKLKLMDNYQHLFDHRQIYQFDAYMAAFASRLGLQ